MIARLAAMTIAQTSIPRRVKCVTAIGKPTCGFIKVTGRRSGKNAAAVRMGAHCAARIPAQNGYASRTSSRCQLSRLKPNASTPADNP